MGRSLNWRYAILARWLLCITSRHGLRMHTCFVRLFTAMVLAVASRLARWFVHLMKKRRKCQERCCRWMSVSVTASWPAQERCLALPWLVGCMPSWRRRLDRHIVLWRPDTATRLSPLPAPGGSSAYHALLPLPPLPRPSSGHLPLLCRCPRRCPACYCIFPWPPCVAGQFAASWMLVSSLCRRSSLAATMRLALANRRWQERFARRRLPQRLVRMRQR